MYSNGPLGERTIISFDTPLRGEENEGHPDVINYRAVINKDEDIRRG
jgi:hypothetical protein